MTNNIEITKDLANKKLHVIREFAAPVEKVWRAWTEAELLDKWWGPRPWNAVTKTMDFKPGGQWLYSMVGPAGETHWSSVAFTAVGTNTFDATSVFSDENGVPAPGFAPGYWHVEMKQAGDKTIVNVTLTFDDIANLEQLVAMGFEGGFTMGLNQLEELLAA
jgi:uncharacterized protein YndB with AHSA1/START domain